MNNKKSAKRTLLTSVLSLVLCMAMLIGTTFAWFTDTVSSINNKIVSGNLDIEMKYSHDYNTWETVESTTDDIFSKELWEPGHTEVVYLRIKNVGSLALKYNLNVNVTSETGSINVAGEEFKLSDHIRYGVVDPVTVAYGQDSEGRSAARAAVASNSALLNTPYAPETQELYPEIEVTVALVVYMPETVGNEANHKTGANAPEINLGINLFASQLEKEKDSFGPDYDKTADYVVTKGEYVTFSSETLEGQVENNGTLNISDSTITNNSTVLQNNGTANLSNVDADVTGGTGYFANGLGENSVTVFENVDATTLGGGVQLHDGAEAIFKSGSITTNSESTSGRHVFYVDNGSQLTIEDGDFTFSPENLERKGFYIFASNGSTVHVSGGNFGKPSKRSSSKISSDYKAGIYADDTSNVIITGGTFKFNPDKWVATGYEAVKAGDTWTVQPIPAVEVATMGALTDAVQNGARVIDANGATLGEFYYDAKFADGMIIKNAKFTYFYGGGVNGTVIFENCKFTSEGGAYSANFDNGDGNLVFNNCVFDGWSSFGTAIKNVEMNNCIVQKSYNYGILRFYQDAQLNNCTFADSAEGVDTNETGTKVVFTNCTGIDGKIFNNGDKVGVWIVDGVDVSETITSW